MRICDIYEGRETAHFNSPDKIGKIKNIHRGPGLTVYCDLEYSDGEYLSCVNVKELLYNENFKEA